MTDNIVEAVFAGRRSARTRAVYQYDYGMILRPIGLELPNTYEVHFGASATGPTTTQFGNDDGVTIPDAMLTTGASVYAYIYLHSGEDDGETVYSIVIPVIARGQITDEQPTPAEQSVITQAIAALNSGVETVQEIADGIPQTIEDALTEAKESGEFDGPQGPQGERGEKGDTGSQGNPGSPGADGFSPTATVTQTSSGATISITDKDGTTTADISNGQRGPQGQQGPIGPTGSPGVDGFSPVANVAQTSTGVIIRITDKQGTTTAEVSNGAKGDPGDDYVLTAADKAEIAQLAAAEVDVPEVATAQQVKAGTDSDHFLAPSVQDNAVFYALAKAAGADMASSSNPVGTYTDAAKIAIQKMLGIYEAPWELIREDTVTNATEADIEITVDGNGQAFELTDIRLVLWTPLQETEASKGDYGKVRFYYSDSNCDYITVGSWTQATSATVPKVGFAEIIQNNGMVAKSGGSPVNRGSTSNVVRYGTDIDDGNSPFTIVNEQRTYIKINIRKVTGKMQYRLYGKRKWN